MFPLKSVDVVLKFVQENIPQFSSIVMALSLLLYVPFKKTLRDGSMDILSAGAGSCVFVMIIKESLQQSGRYTVDALKRLS